MNRRNDRDPASDQPARPIRPSVPHRQVRSRSDSGPIRSVWRWSRAQLQQMAGLARNLLFPHPTVLRYCSGSRCVKGPIREVNEDRCYAGQHCGLFIVADGMGGHAGGERASQAVIEVIASQMSDLLDDPRTPIAELAEAMHSAIFVANRELMELAQVDVGLSGMGATAVIALVRQNQLLLCSVGDSRAYIIRQGDIRQLTVDDTLVQALVSEGALTVGEAARHPMRHVLVHSVGTRRLEKDVHVAIHRLRAGDRLLVTSDGVTDVVARDELAAQLSEYADPRIAATALADCALQAGARDNITCIVVDLFE